MKKAVLFIFTLFASLVPQTSSAQLPHGTTTKTFPVNPLIVHSDNGWNDITLSITKISENGTAIVYTAISTYNGKRLGLSVGVPKTKENKKGYGQGMILESIGAESDQLLLLLADLFKVKVEATSKFIGNIFADYVNLNTFAISMGSNQTNEAETKYKLFFNPNDDEAEIYLNIDHLAHTIELAEKDKEYRALLIAALKK